MKNYFLLLLITLFINCSKSINKNTQLVNEFKSDFKEKPFILIKNLCENFQLGDNSFLEVTYLNSIHVYGYCGFYFVESYELKKFKEKIKLIENKCIFKSTVLDSLNFYIPNRNKEKNKEAFPIFDLNDNFSNLKKRIDFNNSYVFGLLKENGFYFKSKAIKKEEQKTYDYITDNDNGFSNGAIIDYTNNKILYWVIIW